MIVAGMASAGLLALRAVYIRSSGREQREYLRRLHAIEPADIPAIRRECAAAYWTRLRLRLDLNDLDASARSLDAALCSLASMLALAEEGKHLHGAELSGAFMGELIRRHTGATWSLDERQPVLTVRTLSGDETVWPFMDTVNHFKAGHPGELYLLIRGIVDRSRDRRGGGVR